MILEGLNQECNQTPSSKGRISLILSGVGETCAVKCIYLMNKSSMALKLLQQSTDMQGCIRWANWCGEIRTEVSLWDVTLKGNWFLDVRSLWSSPQEVRLWFPYDSHNRKPEIGKKLIFSDGGRRVPLCKNQNKQILQMYWCFYLFLEIFCFMIRSPECFPRPGLAAVLWVAMLKREMLSLSLLQHLYLCVFSGGRSWVWRKERKKKPHHFLYPERSQRLEMLLAFLYGDA